MVEYTFSLNKGICDFLYKLYRIGVPVKTSNLVGKAYSQWTNYTKLAYWGLAVPVKNEESARKRGWWVITDLGKAFIENREKVSRVVVMYRNKVKRFEGPEVSASDISEGYLYVQDYADQARGQIKFDDNGQASFV